jgi:hypothetical protein
MTKAKTCSGLQVFSSIIDKVYEGRWVLFAVTYNLHLELFYFLEV